MSEKNELQRVRGILFRLYNVCAMVAFRPDTGEPHPMPDGAWDRAMADAARELQDYAP